MKELGYGEDFVGWLSYVLHKKDTMEYIQQLEEELKQQKQKRESLETKVKELNKKLRVKRKNENGKKRTKKKTNKIKR